MYGIRNKGINLLKNITTNLDFEKDTLITSITDNHSIFKGLFDIDNEVISKLAFQNRGEFEKHSWYTDWFLRKYNKDMFQYFYDDEYKRKVATYYTNSRQLLRDLKAVLKLI